MSSSNSTPSFRFSLRWLLVFVAVIAVVLTMVVFPLGLLIINWLYAILLRGVLPSMALVGAVFGRGDVRAFALGTLVACISLVFGAGGASFGWGGTLAAILFPAVNIAVCGLSAVAMRRWLVRQGQANEL
jgi:hypothetical protein